jgi:hypothetical protein
MIKKLSLLLVCLFVVTIGFGVSLPVLPFFFSHLHSAAVPRETIAIHTTFLTSIYAFVQLLASPFWGQWSDRVGRRPLIFLGIVGSAVGAIAAHRPGSGRYISIRDGVNYPKPNSADFQTRQSIHRDSVRHPKYRQQPRTSWGSDARGRSICMAD